MWIRELAQADASCGAKAAGLARLIAAGLPVPEGFVLDRTAFRDVSALAELSPDQLPPGGIDDGIGHALAAIAQRISAAAIPPEIAHPVRDRAVALGRLAVRSSASLEDGALGSAAGVFSSLVDLAPADVWDAVRAVWTSALTPLAVAYARRRAAAISISVILQRFVPGERVTVYTRPVGAPAEDDELWVSRAGGLERVPRALASARRDTAIALAAERAIDAPRGADVELVIESTPAGPRPWIVQARPIVHPERRARPAPPPIIIAPLVADGRRWTWDIAHNPDPLSPAQAGLVAAVDRAGCTPYALRVCGGYLYSTPGPARPEAAEPVPPARPSPPADRAELAARIAAIEARFVLGEPESVEQAIERYVAFMAIWTAELSPLVAAARKQLPDRLAREGVPAAQITARVAALIGPRRVVRDRVMSPAWDVAVPTFAERPDRAEGRSNPGGSAAGAQRGASARTAQAPVLPEPPPALADDVALARAAADAAELDDVWFARAQWMVRRALLERSAQLGLRDDDVFWLPLEQVATLRSLEPDEAHRRASAARAAHARAAAWDMPLVVYGHAPWTARATDATLRGVGFGPRVVGRVVRFESLGDDRVVGHGDVVVTRAITPALAMLVDGCAALVSETGGLLDHGAALARELGITCVVGCTGAWAQLADGAVIFVDGDAGTIGLAARR